MGKRAEIGFLKLLFTFRGFNRYTLRHPHLAADVLHFSSSFINNLPILIILGFSCLVCVFSGVSGRVNKQIPIEHFAHRKSTGIPTQWTWTSRRQSLGGLGLGQMPASTNTSPCPQPRQQCAVGRRRISFSFQL